MSKTYYQIPLDKTSNEPLPIIWATLSKTESPYTFTSYDDAETALRFVCDGPEKRKAFESSRFYAERFTRRPGPACPFCAGYGPNKNTKSI